MDGNLLAFATICTVVVGALLGDFAGLVTLPPLPRQAFEAALAGLLVGFAVYLAIPLFGRS